MGVVCIVLTTPTNRTESAVLYNSLSLFLFIFISLTLLQESIEKRGIISLFIYSKLRPEKS